MKNETGYFPLFMDISDKKIVVIGGGNIAARRVKVLSQFCRNLTVVAPRIHPDLLNLEEKGQIRVIRREYEREDIYDAWMVLATTDQHKLNEEIYSVAKCLGALVNVASNREKCDFHFPGIVKKNHFVVGINASGMGHKGAARLKERIEEAVEGAEES